MNDVEAAWVAGLLEGEGCFTFGPDSHRTLSKKCRQLRITCSMTDLDTIQKLHKTVGVGNVHPESRKDKRRDYAKPLYVWSTGKRTDVVWLLNKIRPHMGIRRGARIDEILEYEKNNPPVYNQPIVHGTRRAYRKGCRCQPCKDECARYARELRRSKNAKAED